MANAKKTASADVKDTAAKAAEVKAPAETKAAEAKTETAAAAKSTAPKAEKKTEAKKPGRKPAAKKETAAKADKKPAAKKETAKKETAKTEKKPAAKKAPAKKAEAAKPAAKRGRPAAKAEEKAAPAKRGAKKKQLSYEEILDAVRKKALAADVTKIKYPIAANIILSGNFSENKNAGDDNKNLFYIDINPETESITVAPYKYNDYDVEITADAEELMNVVKANKKNIYDALSDGAVHIHGTTKKAVLLIHAVF